MRAGILLLGLLLPGAVWSAPTADAVTGVWLTAGGQGYIQIYRADGQYHGRAVGAPKDSPRAQDEASRELLGTRVLEGFVYDGDGVWTDGTAYDPDKDKTYSAKMWLEGPDTLKLRGFIGFSLLGRTETWTRASPDAEGVVRDKLH